MINFLLKILIIHIFKVFSVSSVSKNLDELDTDTSASMPNFTSENVAYEAQSARMYNLYGRPYEI